MLKVFLVEDECVVREGLRECIDWARYGFEFCGDAPDGELALPQIRKLRPDILITDIKMPFMDGLALSKLVCAELPETKIILISGHNDFEFAQEAIEIGVEQYLLKPVTKSSLLKTLEDVSRKIDEEREQKAYLRRFQQEGREYEQYARRKFFEQVTSGSLRVSEIYEQAKKLQIDIDAEGYTVILLTLQSRGAAEYSQTLADRLEDDPNVKSAMSYSTTLGRQCTAEQMANAIGALEAGIPVSADMLGMIYYDVHGDGQSVTMTAAQFLRFLSQNVANNATFAPYIDESLTANLQTLMKFSDPAALTQQRTAESLAEFLGMSASDAKQLLLYYYMQHGGADGSGTMTIPAFSNFLNNEVLTDPTMAGMMDDAARAQASQLQTFTDVTAMTTPRDTAGIAALLGMDESTVNTLFIAYHASRGDLFSGGRWEVSMQNIANFLVECGGLLDEAQEQQITQLSWIINGSVYGTQYTAPQLASVLGMDAGQMQQLYMLYNSRHGDTSGWTLSVQQFVNFLCQEVLPDARFASQLSGVDTAQLQSARTVINAVASGQAYTAAGLANLFGGLSSQMDRGTMELLFLYYASVNRGEADWTMSMQELFDYLHDQFLTDARFASFLTDDMRAQITGAQTMLTDAVAQLRGSNYSRLVLTTTLPVESTETSAFISGLMRELDAVTTGDHYLIGNSAMGYEMENSFHSELLLITILTAVSIFLVVVFTFRSLIIPALLVLLVQCGVYITVMVVGLQGLEIYYLALLIVECILMGATIDYGILYTSYYREMRAHMPVRDALIAAYRGSIHTVLTSGSILVLVTAVDGRFFGNLAVEQICRTISIGAFAAILLILLFLPGVLALFDRWVLPRDLRRQLYPPKAHGAQSAKQEHKM